MNQNKKESEKQTAKLTTGNDDNDYFCPECSSLLYPIELIEQPDDITTNTSIEKDDTSFSELKEKNAVNNINNANNAYNKKMSRLNKTVVNDITKNIYMECGQCNYKRVEKTYSTVHYSKYKQADNKSDINLEKSRLSDLLYDKTYLRSNKIKCANEKCPSIKSKKPASILLITSNKHPEIGYICSECKHLWGRY